MEKAYVDGVLGIQTLDRRMVDAHESTELWRPPSIFFIVCLFATAAYFFISVKIGRNKSNYEEEDR